MSYIRAVFRHGVFEPLEPVDFQEEQRVDLSIEAPLETPLLAWLAQVQALQAAVVRRNGPLPNSASEIAADRIR